MLAARFSQLPAQRQIFEKILKTLFKTHEIKKDTKSISITYSNATTTTPTSNAKAEFLNPEEPVGLPSAVE